MKKIIAVILALLMLSFPAFASGFSMREAQNYIYSHSAADAGPAEPSVTVSGTIASITHVKTNHYDMLIEVDDNKAISSIYSEMPLLIAHFRLHIDMPPFAVGDYVTVTGNLNMLYSSHIIPYILVRNVNGIDSDDF